MNKFPEESEYAPFYQGYISLVTETDIISALQDQILEIEKSFAGISDERSAFSYAEGKWSIKELLGHVIDGERVFSYRALRISRNDSTPLASFEENSYVANSNFSETNLADLREEFSLLRKSNVLMFKNFSAEAWSRIGKASDAEISARALAYIMVGHARHHLNILKEKYSSR